MLPFRPCFQKEKRKKTTNQQPTNQKITQENSLYSNWPSLGSSRKTWEFISVTVVQPQCILLPYCFTDARKKKKRTGHLTNHHKHTALPKQSSLQPHSLSEPHTYWLRVDLTLFIQLQQRKELYRKRRKNTEIKTRWDFTLNSCVSPKYNLSPQYRERNFYLSPTWIIYEIHHALAAIAYTNLQHLNIFQISGITDRYHNSGSLAYKFLKEQIDL